MRRSGKLALRLLFSVLVASIFFELLCECKVAVDGKKQSETIQPYYSWSFYTSEGQQVGSRQGILRLMIHPQLVYANFPDQETEYFSINSQGFRGPEITTKGERKRVLVVGGSAAFGTGLRRDSDTFVSKLETQSPHTEFINAAVIGYKSGQELTYLLITLIDLEPDLIIAFDGWNDVYVDPDSKWLDLNEADSLGQQLSALNRLTYSDFLTRCANLPDVIFAKTIYCLRGSQGFTGSMEGTPGGEAHTAAYCRNIFKMNRLAKAYDADFICVLQPTKTLISGEGAENNEYRELCVEAKNYCRLHGIRCIDLNIYTDRMKKDMFMDEIHLDERGNQVIADLLEEELHQRNLLASEKDQRRWPVHSRQ